LTKIHELTNAVAEAEKIASEHLRVAQDRYSERKHTLERGGKQVEVEERHLWEEVFQLGKTGDAYEILKREHPVVFDTYALQDKLAAELKAYTATELGVDMAKLTLADYLRLTEELFDLMMTERSQTTINASQGPTEATTGTTEEVDDPAINR